MSRLQRLAATVLSMTLAASLQHQLAPTAHAREPEQPVLSEHGIKAAFLLNFLLFVRWPDEPLPENAEFDLCVASTKDFLRILEPLAAASGAGGHAVHVRAIETERGVASCHALYLDRRTVKNVAPFLGAVRGSSILTVADTEEFLEAGGMIQILTEGNKAFFKVSLLATEEAKLVVSARLLQLAQQVVRGAH